MKIWKNNNNKKTRTKKNNKIPWNEYMEEFVVPKDCDMLNIC